jgi:general secretion pathway protein K
MSGAALLLVMWLIALLTALIGGFALAARIEHMQGVVLSRGFVAAQAARAGAEYAITRVAISDPRLRWLSDGRPYPWTFANARIEVRIVDESGKVDLNNADATLLTGLFRALGQPRAQAGQMASAILDWRDADSLTQPAGGAEDADYASAGRPYGAKDAPFEDVAEVQQVLGMTPALYAQAAGLLTVYTGRAQPDPAFAAAPVLTAMGLEAEQVIALRERYDPASGQPQPTLPGGQPLVAGSSGTYSIESRARLADGRKSVLRIVVRTGGNGVPGSAYTPLRWEEGASLR